MPCAHTAHAVHAHAHATGRLRAAMAVSIAVMCVEAVGGHLSHSLSLWADAGHVATDIIGLVVALVANQLGKRPANAHYTFGYRRWETLAAAFNGLLLVVVAGALAAGALQRLGQSLPVDPSTMLGAGSISLLGNLTNVALLRRHQPDDVNTRGAFLHVLADALCATGVIFSAVVMRTTGWYGIDTWTSLAIAAMVGFTGAKLVGRVLKVVAQAAPSTAATEAIGACLSALPSVRQVQQVRLWSLTVGHNVATAHLQVLGDRLPPQLLEQAHAQLRLQCQIAEATLQVELVPPGHGHGHDQGHAAAVPAAARH